MESENDYTNIEFDVNNKDSIKKMIETIVKQKLKEKDDLIMKLNQDKIKLSKRINALQIENRDMKITVELFAKALNNNKRSLKSFASKGIQVDCIGGDNPTINEDNSNDLDKSIDTFTELKIKSELNYSNVNKTKVKKEEPVAIFNNKDKDVDIIVLDDDDNNDHVDERIDNDEKLVDLSDNGITLSKIYSFLNPVKEESINNMSISSAPIIIVEKGKKDGDLQIILKTDNLLYSNEILYYELYCLKESEKFWQNLGNIDALKPPIICTLSNLDHGSSYQFVSRAVYTNKSRSDWSKAFSFHNL